MKTIIISIFMAMMAIAAQAQQKSFYDFTVKTIDGEDISLSTFKGKKVLVVNVASKCGFINPEKPDVPLNKNDAFQKVQKRRVQEKR